MDHAHVANIRSCRVEDGYARPTLPRSVLSIRESGAVSSSGLEHQLPSTSGWPPRWLVLALINVALVGVAAGQLWSAHQRQGLIDGFISCGATPQNGQVVQVTNVSSSGEPLAVELRFADGTTAEVEIADSTDVTNNHVRVLRCPDSELALSEADFAEGNSYLDAVGTALLMAGFSILMTWLIIKLAPA